MPEYPTLDDLEPAPGPTDSAPAPAPPTSASSPARSVLEWLESEGFRARIDEEGDVHLRHEGRDVFVVFDVDDPAYVRVLAPAFWKCDDAEQRFLALAVANRLNAALEVAKISLRTDGAACVAVELFVAAGIIAIAITACESGRGRAASRLAAAALGSLIAFAGLAL